MIDPKALDISSLPSVYLESKSELPRKSAIYFAIDSQGNIQYIGRSSDIKQRWIQHHRFSQLTSIGNIRIAYLCMDADILPSVEKALIEWFQPFLNGCSSEDVEVGIAFKIKDSFRTKANIAAQILRKSVTQICIEALEKAIAKADLIIESEAKNVT